MGDNLPNIDKAENSVQLVAGGLHTCARFKDQPTTCWGNNENGQLGDVPHITAVTAIAAGNEHTCALLSSGKTKCWGNGYYGQVGYTGSHPMPPVTD
jgi:alpha-tubulin suppressor-like RCC1 family protein